jgi:hypothetical protein
LGVQMPHCTPSGYATEAWGQFHQCFKSSFYALDPKKQEDNDD